MAATLRFLGLVALARREHVDVLAEDVEFDEHTVVLPASATEHRRVDFTGGYTNYAHRMWDIQCEESGLAAVVRFTAFDTQPDVDSVRLHAGDSESEATKLTNPLSGSTVPAGAYAARAGELLMVFVSGSTGVADGFAFQYWCAASDSIGCTDPSALNFNPAATADDGSCHVPYVRAQCPSSTAALSASTTEHRQLNFTGGYTDFARCVWDIQCEESEHALLLRFATFDMEQGWDYVSLYEGGELRAYLTGQDVPADTYAARTGELAVILTSDPAASGNGFAAQFWCVQADNVGCTGPTAPNFNPAAIFDDGSCDWGEETDLLAAFQVDPTDRAAWDSLGGWDIATSACHWEQPNWHTFGHFLICDRTGRVTSIDMYQRSDLRFTLSETLGILTALQVLVLAYTGLHGTIPESVGNLADLNTLYLMNTRLSGTVPSGLGPLEMLSTLTMHDTGLSGTLPFNLCDQPAPWVQQDALDLHNMRLQGAPDFSRCTNLQTLSLTNNSFTGLPAGLPPSLTHAYLDANPLDATAADLSQLTATLPNLHALSVDLVNVPIILEQTGYFPDPRCNVAYPVDGVHTGHGDLALNYWSGIPHAGCQGTKVTRPTECTVGVDCSWELQLKDADNQPARAGSLVTGLTLGMNCSCDREDCGEHTVHTRHGDLCPEGTCASDADSLSTCFFKEPMVDNRDGTFTATVPADWVQAPGDHSFRFFHEGTEIQLGYYPQRKYLEIRTLQYSPRVCPPGKYGPGWPDCSPCVSWAVCPGGTATPSYCPAGQQANRLQNDCEACPFGTGGGGYLSCSKCSLNEEAREVDGVRKCVCKAGTMNATKGTVTCYNHDACNETVEVVPNLVCVTCPECLDCETHDRPFIKPEFGLTVQGLADYKGMWADGQSDHRQVHVFRCPIKGACLGETETNRSDMVLSCLDGHDPTSPFCTLCKDKWMGGNNELCTTCEIGTSQNEAVTLVVVIVGGLLTLYCGHGLYTNLERRMRETNVAYTDDECEIVGSCGRNASLIVYMKVICSHLQLLHQFPIVLDLDFPKIFQDWLELLSFLTFDIFKVFSVQCAFETNLYNKFIFMTTLPVLAVLVLAAWSHVKHRKPPAAPAAAKDDGEAGAGLSRQLAEVEGGDDDKQYDATDDGTDAFLQRVFVLLFAVFPMLSTKTFHFFSCRKYDDENLHMFDFHVDCNSIEYKHYKLYAYLTVLVYPIGILVTFASLLYLNRVRIRRSETTYDRSSDADGRWFEGGSHKFRFLVADYRKEYFWYEVFETARKLVFTFMLGFANQGTASQIFGGLLAAVFFLVFNALAQPFADFRVNYLRVLADIQLCLTMAGCLMLKVDLDCDNLSPDFIAWFLVIINIFLTALTLCVELARRLALFVVGNTGLHGVLYFPGRVLGRGEDSVVFEGLWRPLSIDLQSFGDALAGHPVAVKRCTSCSNVAMVMLSNLTHDNVRIPLTIETGKDGHFYVVSDLCDGTLTDAVTDKELPGFLKEVCKQIVDGVCRTHAAGILHTRLTPDNIVLDGDTAKISGWGNCRSLTDYIDPSELDSDTFAPLDGGAEAHTFNPIGSDVRFLNDVALAPAAAAAAGIESGWQAPELLSKKLSTFDATSMVATDVFSLGVTLFFTLSGGGHPYGADADARNANILSGQHLVHDLSTTGLSEDAKDLISSMLDPVSEKRITMQAVREHPFFWSNVRKGEYLAHVGDMLIPKVHRSSTPFLLALEEAIDMRLGGQYIESESKTCSSWAGLLDPKYPLTGKWQGQASPQDVEHNYHVYGGPPSRKQADARQKQLDNGTTTQAPMEIRTVGLLKFVRNVCVAHRVQMVQSGQFESEDAVMRCT